MSICSTHSGADAPEATVSWKGYRLTTTSSNGSISSSSSCLTWEGFEPSASRPACTLGCRVLTRPPRHSGKPVSDSTGVTGTPNEAIFDAVPPVDTISTPAASRARASSSSPDLS